MRLTPNEGTTPHDTHDGYDLAGNRTKQARAGCLESRYVYDGPNVVLDLNASNQVVNAYVNGLGIDQPVERIAFLAGTQSTRLVYHTDALGSVVAMTDSAQSAVKSYTYEAFGRIWSETENPLTINRYSFTAREALGDSLGLYYYRWRVMDPNTGRFTGEDPLQFRDGPNVYSYAVLNPMRFNDPWGLAYIGSRALDHEIANRLYYGTELGREVLRHDQIWYTDTGENIGYFREGFREDHGHTVSEYDFNRDPRYYDDTLMREAERNVRARCCRDFSTIANNCQDYVNAVRTEYDRLERARRMP